MHVEIAHAPRALTAGAGSYLRGRLRRDLSARDERELRQRLSGWARGYLGMPDQEIPDAYQSAWRKVLDQERQGRPVRNLEHALRWGIGNCWREECRRRQRHPTSPLDDAPVRVPGRDSGPDLVEVLERQDVARYLAELAASVGELPWRVVFLRRVVGLAPAQVCQVLGISARMYRTEHARGVKIICTSLAEDLADRDCASRRRALRAVAADAATAAERDRVDRHTRHCSSCRRLLVTMRSASASPSA